MATGYNIIQPNGTKRTIKASSLEERKKIVDELLAEWGWYCEKNWVVLNNSSPYSPENKVKNFLSGLSYFLIMGNADDIVTDYKQVMNGKREIPVSSCPSFVEDKMYSGVHANNNEMLKKAETECFSGIVKSMDDRAERRYGVTSKQRKRVMMKSRNEKIKEIEASGVQLQCEIVNTDNEFVFLGSRFHISESMCPQYSPKKTKSGILYDMDSIYIAMNAQGCIVSMYDGDLNEMPSGSVIAVET